MKIVAAPQALKGSLDAAEVGAAIAAGVRRVAPEAVVEVVPVADGGEGTVAALVAATEGRLFTARVTGPLGEPVAATFGLLGPGAAAHDGAGRERTTAVVEMAAASGLPLVPPARRDPRAATTRGTGELLRAALDSGARRILVGIGGSATNDGGAGMAQALGARLLDAAGRDLPPGGAALARLEHVDVAGLDPRLRDTEVVVASDVINPLCGPTGASAVYGPQKGATPAVVAELDAALARYAAVLRRDLGVDVAERPGAGAAGGLGAGLMAFLGAQLRPGAQLVLEAVGFERRLDGASVVFTAEGRLDEQTAYGKAVGAVAAAAHRRGIPVVVLAGGLAAGYERLYAAGVGAVLTLPDGPLSLEESMARAGELVRGAAERAMRLMLLGARLGAAAPPAPEPAAPTG
jgi:glycerate kinase